eukprot:4222900-Alexandrium_andersonii.AAC.1
MASPKQGRYYHTACNSPVPRPAAASPSAGLEGGRGAGPQGPPPPSLGSNSLDAMPAKRQAAPPL